MPRDHLRDPERGLRILLAARSLIAQHGYPGVSMADIGTEAGIVGSGVYRHFGSKSAILVALFDEVVDRLVADADALLHERATRSVAGAAAQRPCRAQRPGGRGAGARGDRVGQAPLRFSGPHSDDQLARLLHESACRALRIDPAAGSPRPVVAVDTA